MTKPEPRPVAHRWSAWSAWVPTLREIKEGSFPHLPTIADAMRGDEPVPQQVRIFLAQLIDRNRIKHPGKGRPSLKTLKERKAVAAALRGADPVTVEVRAFWIKHINQHRIKYPSVGSPKDTDIITGDVLADFARATFEDVRDEIRKIPKAERHETPTVKALPKAAKALVKNGMMGKTGKALSDSTIQRRARRPGGPKRRP